LIPKPLVPLGGKYSILEVILMQLAREGFIHVTLAINHLAGLIQAYFGDGSRFGLKIDYSLEENELSTIGPLTLIDNLPENFLVMNGDILCDLDYGNFFRSHVAEGAGVSVSSYKREVKIDFGVLESNPGNQLTRFVEKPTYHFDVSMGIYCLSRRIVEALPPGQRYGFDNLMLDSLEAGREVRIVPFNGYWLDIGRPDDYETADKNFDELAARLGI
jgi:NDP-sugar pyrophosphorylase family protein